MTEPHRKTIPEFREIKGAVNASGEQLYAAVIAPDEEGHLPMPKNHKVPTLKSHITSAKWGAANALNNALRMSTGDYKKHEEEPHAPYERMIIVATRGKDDQFIPQEIYSGVIAKTQSGGNEFIAIAYTDPADGLTRWTMRKTQVMLSGEMPGDTQLKALNEWAQSLEKPQKEGEQTVAPVVTVQSLIKHLPPVSKADQAPSSPVRR